MKKFKDLQFKPHQTGEGLHAVMFFKNGYGVSIVRFKMAFGYGSYTDNDSEWELAVLFGNEKECTLTYNTPITDDVIGHLTETEVTDVMIRVQELPSAVAKKTLKKLPV